MNEVFDIANTLEAPIYYTDTDSLHCNFKDIPKIENAYYKKYNKILTGKHLGQFHTDFKLDGAQSEIYATKSIFLGKKSYIDHLESTDENGDIIHGYHVRLKGITKEGIAHAAEEEGDVFKLFEKLASGESKKMILNPFDESKNSQKVLFEFKNGRVSTKNECSRTIKF